MFEHASKHIFGLIDTGIDVNISEREEILKKYPIPKFRDNKAIHTAPMDSVITTTSLISDCTLGTTQKGDPILKMRVHDSVGSYSANIFHRPGLDLKDLKESVIDEYEFFEITAKVSEFPKKSGKKTLNITNVAYDDVKKRTPEAYMAYLPKCKANMEDIVVEMYLILNTLSGTARTIALDGLEKFWDKFVLSPAAKRHHHAYVYGLLEHTWGLLRLGYFLSKDDTKDVVSTTSGLYMKMSDLALKEIKKYKTTGRKTDEINGFNNSMSHVYWILTEMAKHIADGSPFDRDLALASIIWHDMGKIDEYTIVGGIGRHPITGIIEHRVIGPLLFQKFIEEKKIELDEKIYWHYMSIMVSHHGKVEWGSPAMPASIEGWLVHLVDYLDSQFQGTNK